MAASSSTKDNTMPVGRRGLIVPQNTFLEDVIRRSDNLRESFIVGSAEIFDYPIVYCSTAFTQLTGFSRSEVMKHSCHAKFLFGSSAPRKDVSETIQHALNRKQDCQVEFVGRKKDGAPLWYLLHIAPVQNEQSKVVLFLITVRDISEFKDPISGNEASSHKWVKIKRTIKTERNAFVVAFSKTKEEKNKIRIAQLMEQNSDFVPQYKQQIPKPPKKVILHYSFFKVVWDWFVLLLILYTVSAVPFVICFQFEDSVVMISVDCLVDLFFFIDIVANFHTSYVAQDGEIVTDMRQIRHYYLTTWFLPDLVTSIPYGLLVFVSKNTIMINLISFFKCIRLLRISRIIRKLDQYINYGVLTLMLCIVAFLLFAHWMACIFYLIARSYDGFHEVGWVAILARQTKQPFNTTVEGDALLPTIPSLYVSSLYYCLTSLTTIGFGNISPNTTAEKIFGCITMIIGALYYAVIFGQVTAIVHQAQRQSEKYHGLLENIKSFQKLYKVPVELSARILDYFMSTWALTKGVDTDEVLKQCPKDLQSDICIHLNRKILYHNPAFNSMPMGVMRTIARSFCICHVAPGDRVVHVGDSLDILYFISHGSFEVKQNECVVGLLGQGDVFGDDVCNETSVGKSRADVYALTYSDLHCIDRSDLAEILMSYPETGVEFSHNLKLSYNLRGKVRRQSTAIVYTDASPTETREQLGHVNGAMHLGFPAVRGARRLSLVQELNQTIDLDNQATTMIDSGTPRDNEKRCVDDPSKSDGINNVTKSKPITSGILVQVNQAEALPEDNFTESRDALKAPYDQEPKAEARLSFSCGENSVESDVAQLKVKFEYEMCEVNVKLGRIEEQLSLISSVISNMNRPAVSSARVQSPCGSGARLVLGVDVLGLPDGGEEYHSPSWLARRRSDDKAEQRRRKSAPNLEEAANEEIALVPQHGRRKLNNNVA